MSNWTFAGGRREDDWTCPSCGNVNFSFRTTCNMRNCTQPRPADHNSLNCYQLFILQKFAPKPMQTQQGYSSPAPYVGAPSPMYIGVAPYGSSLFNGSSMPHYDVGSSYQYNYGSRSPYRPLQFSGPPPMIAECSFVRSILTLPPPTLLFLFVDAVNHMLCLGGLYAIPQLMDRYGLAFPMGHTAMGSRPGYFPEEKAPKKDGKGDNDWPCPKCGNVNFSFRTVCNMRKCNTPKPGSQARALLMGDHFVSGPDMPDGSWKCDQCNNINYPFRTKCNRQNCGAEKPSESQKSPSQEVEDNDQHVLVWYFSYHILVSSFIDAYMHSVTCSFFHPVPNMLYVSFSTIFSGLCIAEASLYFGCFDTCDLENGQFCVKRLFVGYMWFRWRSFYKTLFWRCNVLIWMTQSSLDVKKRGMVSLEIFCLLRAKACLGPNCFFNSIPAHLMILSIVQHIDERFSYPSVKIPICPMQQFNMLKAETRKYFEFGDRIVKQEAY
ncbi:Zinc finger, RanBP2-type [Artemisia annua]|uniref:Zinc finger, RanBP2-type n=1 Tax=Artemisia annua TaxID=35608 RepID=A0A2U1PSV5_ARTAN|nr:Zinc finger, RanBP2-type [Artemisia annua]